MAIELLCIRCGARSTSAVLREADSLVRCDACTGQLEFRQMHEAACASHRAEILRRCPGLLGLLEPDWLKRPSLRAVDASFSESMPELAEPAKR